MSNPHDILIRPVLTEKSTDLSETGSKLVFRVKRSATKTQIRHAIESLMGVKVASVNTMTMPSKPKRVGRYSGRRSGFKKAVITLRDGEVFDFFGLAEDEVEAEGEV